MNKLWRKVLIILGLLVFVFILFFCISIFGTPWDRYMTVQKLTPYLEEKYEINFRRKETMYNFKDGTYGAKYVSPEGIEFLAEVRGKNRDVIYDYYPEAVWKKQLSDEFETEVKVLFPNNEYVTMDGVYGVSHEMNISNKIVHFKDVDSMFYIHIRLLDMWHPEIEAKTIQKLYELVKLVQDKEIQNVRVTLYFKEEEDSKVTRGFDIPHENISSIKSEEDIKKFVKKIG